MNTENPPSSSQPVSLRTTRGRREIALFLLLVVLCGLTVMTITRRAQGVAKASALCDAAQAGNVEKVKRLLREGTDPNQLNALGYAKMGGHKEVIVILEQAGARDKRLER
jgi:hypothetical protein